MIKYCFVFKNENNESVLNDAKIMDSKPIEQIDSESLKKDTESISEADKSSTAEATSLTRINTLLSEPPALENVLENGEEKLEIKKKIEKPIEPEPEKVSVHNEICKIIFHLRFRLEFYNFFFSH